MNRLSIREAVKIYGDNWIKRPEFYQTFLYDLRDSIRAIDLIQVRNIPSFKRQSIYVYWGTLS